MMKKLMTGLLAALMILSLAACGGNTAPSSSAEPSSATPSSSAAEPAPASSEDPSSAGAESSAPASDIPMPTYPDAATVDLAKVEEEIKALAPKVKTVTEGKLVLGTSADYAPYEFHIMKDGVDTIVGFDVALAQAIADELGVELEIHDIPFDSILLEVNLGSIDVAIAGFSPTPKRLQAVDMSHLYELQNQSLLIRKEDVGKYQTIADFGAGTKVGAQTSSLQEELAQAQAPDADHVSIQAIPSLVIDLQSKNIDAVVMETAVAEGYVQAKPDELAILCEVPCDSNGKAVVVKKGNEDLLNFVNAVVTKVVANGDMQKFIEEANAISDQSISG